MTTQPPADNASDQAANPEEAKSDDVEFSVSGGLAATLAKLNISLAMTSYQSGLLYLIGRNKDGGINIHQTAMPKPMGLSTGERGDLTMTAGYQIMRMENILQPGQEINHTFDACYVPRTVHLTGKLDAHDVGIDEQDRAVFVNTRFNCLAVPSARHSFEMIWKPDFISGLVDEDRCHLNGLAMRDGAPAFVTAVSRSDVADGWRDRRASGGIVIDVESESEQIVAEGLSMPHSPRWHDGRLWVLNSGTGFLGTVDLARGVFEPVCFCPGFARGMTIVGDYAVVGLSKPRDNKTFADLPLAANLQQRDTDARCGLHIVDLHTGDAVHWLRIEGVVAELYDVVALPGVRRPMAIGFVTDEIRRMLTVEDSPSEG
ncbi:MAG: TIGR03032 family protein [Henriciella sp.]|nr:TIGR03032 family protein [Henriciella sp.]